MSMRYEDFLNLTPRQFFNAANGFIEKEQRIAKESWQRTSVILAYIANKPVHGYKIRPTTPQKLLPFAWNESNTPTEDELEQLRRETWPEQQQ